MTFYPACRFFRVVGLKSDDSGPTVGRLSGADNPLLQLHGLGIQMAVRGEVPRSGLAL